jgi:predicted  nucleic acid-binding Zn-ribbon protein
MAEPGLKAVTEIFKTIGEREKILEQQDADLAEREAQLALADDTLKRRREYAEALERHIAGLEGRLRELREAAAPEERKLQGRLADLRQQEGLAQERTRQAQRIEQMAIDEAAALVRRLRGGDL